MGLGLNGGGLESARFFAKNGARVTVTDLRTQRILAPSLEQLEGLPLRYVLGKHVDADFETADIVIKNPAVRPDSPYLAKARRIETDMSVFLSLCPGPVLAVTGSKGKSTTASALHYGLLGSFPGARLGGNITTSPLSFLEELGEGDPVTLELSSWQLGDLRGRGLLRPRVAIITNIFPDHLDRYGCMEAYVADKKVIYESQEASGATVCFAGDRWGEIFARETPGTPYMFSRESLPEGVSGAWLEEGGGVLRISGGPSPSPEPVGILPRELRITGAHHKINLLAAGLGLYLFGLPPPLIRERMAEFPGIEHRLELCGEKNGVSFYNDSAATIPEALAAALQAFPGIPLRLIAGGTDKELDFSVLRAFLRIPRGIYLLEGTATAKLQRLLESLGIAYNGPCASLEDALREAWAAASRGEVILFSPGCTSFGMFLHEFDRGRKFKALVAKIIKEG
jgi:UDP-N-acetylmuramoylalanine--D-glutamate ligase